MRFLIVLLIYILATVWPTNTIGQNPFYYNYSINEGLPSNKVYYVFQDSKGIMWFSTNAGISVFDGYKFKTYTTEDGLSDNEIFQIHEDKKGRFWFSTLNGKPCYYDIAFHSPENTEILKDINFNYPIFSFLETKNGSILLGSSKGGAVKIYEKKIIRNTNDQPFHFMWEQNNHQFAIRSSGIIEINDDLSNYKTIVKKLLGPYINRAIQINDTIYIAQGDSIFTFSKNAIRPWTILPKEEEVVSLSHLSDNNLWVGTRNGVYVIDMAKKDNKPKHFFNNLTISCVLEDREGNIWVTTLENGVYFMPTKNVYFLKDNEKKSDIILKIEKTNDNKIWMSKPQNTYSVYSFSGELKNYRLENNREQQISNIRDMAEFGTWVMGKENILQLKDGGKLFFPYWSNDILIDDDSCLWIAASYIVKIPYHQWTKNMVSLSNLKKSKLLGPENILSSNIILKSYGNIFKKDKEGNIWIGTNNGLYKYDKNKYLSEIIKGKIFDLKYDFDNDELLVATQENGIAIIKNSKTVFINKKDNLLSNVSYSVAKDYKNNIWVATSNGLNKISYDASGYSVKNYSSFIGLPSIKINNIQSDGDTIYLATDNGLYYFYSQQIRRSVPPLIHINNFRLRDSIIDLKKTCVFNYYDNALTFNFIGISYRDMGNITYNYMLVGHDTSWQKTSMQEIQYNALAPGDYTFKVVAVNGFGIKSETPESISFTILRPFWEKWWFRVFIVLFIAAILFFFWKMRIKNIKNKFELKRKAIELEKEKIKIERDLVSVEQKALRLQMNPHFIFNALNTIKGYYAESNVQQASEYIGKFSKLLRFILENTEPLISLKNEVEILHLYLDLVQIRYKNKFEFKIIIGKEVNQSETSIPPMLLQPFVENAIIHGLAPKEEIGELIIQFNIVNEYLVCTVIDNGVGVETSKAKNKNKEHHSMATQITKERLHLYEEEKKCTLEITELTGELKGTKVEIRLPIKNLWK